MTPEVLTQAMDLFFLTRAGTHVGLGLGSCVAIMEAMAGQITIESTPDVGTIVHVTYLL